MCSPSAFVHTGVSSEVGNAREMCDDALSGLSTSLGSSPAGIAMFPGLAPPGHGHVDSGLLLRHSIPGLSSWLRWRGCRLLFVLRGKNYVDCRLLRPVCGRRSCLWSMLVVLI